MTPLQQFMYTADAPQRALGFLVQQQAYIEPTVYQTAYQDLQYASLIPVDTSAPEWISTITYYSVDSVGKAEWFSAKAQDVPRVELSRDKAETTVGMGAIGYGYDLEEIAKAMMVGINLTTDKAAAARRVAEEMIERVAFSGDTSKGFLGLVNQSSVTADTVPADGTGSSTLWSAKTPDQVLRDVNLALTGMWTGSLGTEIADTLLLPASRLADLGTRRIDAVNQTTLIEWIARNNIYTLQTQQPLTIRGVMGFLDTAGASSSARMIAYRRHPDVLKLHVPMPFRFLEAMRVGALAYEVPGIMRLGGVDVKRPKAMRYRDGL